MRPGPARVVPHPTLAIAVTAGLLALATPAYAYIGPGAGFAVMSSFLVIFVTMLVVALSVLAWPFRALWRLVRGAGPPKGGIGRFIVIGFDGQDPALTDQYLREGLLPNFARLQQQGTYRRLQTTYPALSPVAAWHECRHGRIEAGWTLRGDAVTYRVTLPKGCEGILTPKAAKSGLTVNGKPATQGQILPPGTHEIAFRI